MPPDTRQSMVLAAVELLRERGVDGVTLDAVLSRSGAPRGSIYHHFPDGRAQIIDEAAQLSGDAISRLISKAAPDGPAAVVDAVTAFWRKLLRQNKFAVGCPVVSIAVSAAPGSALAQHANQIFRTWHQLVTDCLVADGVGTVVARRLATMSLGAIEGAITMCRATSSLQPLDDVNAELKLLLAARTLFAAGASTPRREVELMEWTGAVYADAPTVEVSTWIDAPVARVWELASDITVMPECSSELQRVEWLGDCDAPCLGARFVGHNSHPALGDWSTECEIVEYEPQHVMAWAIGDAGNPTATWRLSLRPEGTGTRLVEWAQMGPAPSGLSLAIARMPDKEQKIVFNRLREFESGMQSVLAHIKQRAES